MVLCMHQWASAQDSSPTLIRGDRLEVVGAKPVDGTDGMGYIDLGQWAPEKEYSFVLRRPKGAGADYAVSVWYQVVDVGLYTLARDNRHDDNFYSRPLSKPQYEWDSYQWDGWNCVVFKPGETEKTITVLTEDPSRSEMREDLGGYIRFCYANRTSVDYDLLQLRLHNPDAKPASNRLADGERLVWSSYGFIQRGSMVKSGEWMMLNVDMAGSAHFFDKEYLSVVVGADTRLSIVTGSGARSLVPLQPVGTNTFTELLFAYRATDDDVVVDSNGGLSSPLKGTGISGVRLNGGSQTYDVDFTGELFYSMSYKDGAVRPRFGAIATDKSVYAPREVVTARVAVANWQKLNAVYGSEWLGCVALTSDGGETALNSSLPVLDEQTGELVFTFNAANPPAGKKSATHYAELMISGVLLPTDDKDVWWVTDRLPYLLPADAFFSYGVEGDAVIVSTTGIELRGMPEGNTLRKEVTRQRFTLSAAIQPADCAFMRGRWTSSNTTVATVSAGGLVEVQGSGFADITFTSEEADYRAALGMAPDPDRLTKTVRLHVKGILPEDDKEHKFFTSDDETVRITAMDIRPHFFYEYYHPTLDDWECASDEATVVLRHHDPAAYPDITLTAPIEPGGRVTVDIPFNDKTFLRKRYQNDDHSAQPTCTAFITVPMRNKNDGELHTYTCEYEVYHDLTNAEFASNLNDDGVVVVDDSGKGHVRVTFAKLDREEGFELELGHLYDDPMLGREWLRRKFAPGEIGMFEGEKVVDGNIALRMMPDRRYVEATVDFDFVMVPQYVNAIYARAQNVYSRRSRENFYGFNGVEQYFYKGEQYVGWDFSGLSPHYGIGAWGSGGYAALTDDAWAGSNDKVYQTFLSTPTYANYGKLIQSQYVTFDLNPPKPWGDLRVVLDHADTVKVVKGNGKYCAFSVGFPLDDQRHTVTFCWPDVGLEKSFDYTTYGKELADRYYFNARVNGRHFYVSEFELNYVTSEGNRKTAVVKGERISTGRYGFFLTEAETIDTLSVTDHVAEGEEHAVITPTMVYAPFKLLTALSKPVLLDNVMTTDFSKNNDVVLNTLDEMGLRFVDATTGEPVTQGVTVSGFYEGFDYISADKYTEFSDDGAIHTPLYNSFEICADGYTPRLLRYVRFNNRNIVIDGQKSFMSNGKIVCTVALRPDTGDGFVDILDVATNEIAPEGTREWPNHRPYMGTDMLVPYDGSLKPGRKIKVLVGTDNPPDNIYITSSAATNGKKIQLVWQKPWLFDNEVVGPSNLSQRYFEYVGEMRDFLYSEVEGDTRLTTDDNRSMAFLRMKNIDKDPMALIKDMSIEPKLPTTQVGKASKGVRLGKMQKQFDNFDLQLPSTLPFTIVVKKENGDYFFRALYSKNFLPGGRVMDVMDKTDLIGDIDRYFYECQQMTRRGNRRREYDPDDRLLAFPTAFAGIRAWAEGRLVYDYDTDCYSFALGGLGIKAEASGYAAAKIPLGFGSFGTSVQGEVSATAELTRPDDDDLKRATTPLPMDITLDFLTQLKVSAYAELGIDLWVASAKAGIRGSGWGSFESRMTTKPYLGGETEGGVKLELGASLEAYAKAKFLFWSKTWSSTLLKVNGTWYAPNDDSNPLKREDNGDALGRRVRLRSAIYKPLRLSSIPDGAHLLLSDIDAFAQPVYLFGGTDMAYIRPAASSDGLSGIQMQSGTEFPAMDGYNVFDIAAASRPVGGAKRGIVAYTANSSRSDSAPEQVANDTRVYVSTGDGSAWTAPYGLGEYFTANMMPTATVSPTGKYAVVWKAGRFVPDGGDDDPTAGHIDGNLLFSYNDGSGWSDNVQTMMTINGRRQLADYSMAMADDVPMVVGTVIDSLADGTMRSRLTALTLSDERLPLEMPSDIVGTQPQVVALGSGYYVGVLTAASNGQADVRLMKLSAKGAFTDMGMLGLDNRGVVDFKLIAPESASGLDGMAVVWKEAKREYTDYANDVFTMKTAVYGARISQSDDGKVYISCPQKLLSQDDNLVITYYDAVFSGNKLTAAITVADDDTEGANVLTSEVTFDNSLKCEYAGLAANVEEGKDISVGFVVMNEGYEAIDYVDIDINGKVTTARVGLMPGHSTEVTATAPADTDLDQPLTFDITPYFSSSPMAVRSLAQARERAAGMPGVARRMAKTRSGMGQLKVNVVDVAVCTLSAAKASDGGCTVVAAVDNLSPMAFAADWQVKVGLYRDAAGTQLFSDDCVTTLPASALHDDSGNNTATAVLHVKGLDATTTLYLVAHTIDSEGRVLTDQTLTDNMSPVSVYVSDAATAIDKPTTAARPKFTVRDTATGIEVSGVSEGDNIRVYTASGQLVGWAVAKSSSCHLPLTGHGVYVVTNGVQSESIRH